MQQKPMNRARRRFSGDQKRFSGIDRAIDLQHKEIREWNRKTANTVTDTQKAHK